MISITDKKNCCGCSACIQICPQNCISMKEDDEGFLYPEIHSATCINCNVCEKVCPVVKADGSTSIDTRPEAYIAYQNDEEIRLNSSSGGLFTPFAVEILKRKGIVFGAAFDKEFLVYHTAIDSMEDLEKLRGSKYLQSRIEQTYKEAKKCLRRGQSVLYTGTACQIAGLKAFLGRDYENLYTIDVLCHGVPTPKLWKKYLAEQEKIYGADVRRIFFRHKKYGWKTYAVSIDFTNEMAYERIYTKDAFMQLFLSDICLRPSCHDCHFKGIDRPSDITLGDCWGVENYMPEMDDNRGTSVMLVHTERGRELLEKISNQLKICPAELDRALPPTADSRKSVLPHPKRKQFFVLLNRGESIQRLTKLIQPSMASKVYKKFKRLIRKSAGIFGIY